MGIREWAHNHPKVSFPLLGTCVALCIAGIVMQVFGRQHAVSTKMPDQYFSIDDGKTFFQAAGSNVAPFDRDGHTAYRAYVFECDGKRFVGYLERYLSDARKIVLAGGSIPASVELNGRELKKPGDTIWISSSDMNSVAKIANVSCPNGSGSAPVPIEP